MGSAKKKTEKTCVEILKENLLYIGALFFQILVTGSLTIYHIFVGVYWIVAIHAIVLISVVILSIYLKRYNHQPKIHKPCRNQIMNSSKRDRVVIVPTRIKPCEAVSVDEATLKNASTITEPVIVRPPIYEFTKKTIRSKQLVYFTLETDLVNFKYCSTCKNWRAPSALHCGKCDCCVYNFDHHCMWLNNCITRSNYKTFIAYVILVFFGSYFSVFSVFQLFFISKDVNKLHFGILLSILALFAIFGAIFTSILIGFHINLTMKRISTYEYIKIKHSPEVTNNTHYFSEKRLKIT